MIEAVLADRRARFILIGGAATLVHALMLGLLVEGAGLEPTPANLLAFISAFLVSYVGHKQVTFRSSAPHTQALPRFLLAALAGLFVNVALFAVFADMFGVHYWIVFALVIVTAPFVVYVVSRDYAFQDGQARAGGLFRGLEWRCFIIPALCFLVTLVYTLTLYHPVFYFDHWDLLPMMEAVDQDGLEVGQLFTLHGSHWHATGYIVMLALGKYTGFAHGGEVLASLVFALIAFWGARILLARQVRALSDSVSLCVPIAILGLFMFSLDQSQNWLWGWQTAVFGHLVGVIWCLEALTRERLNWRSAVFACLMAALAIYGFATGWALLPIGFAILLARKTLISEEGWEKLAIWAVFSALMAWHMSLALGARGDAVSADAVPSLAAPLHLYVLYAMNYAASAVTRFSPDIALPIFLISVGILAWCVIVFYRAKQHVLMSLAPALALMLYAGGAGMLTGLGRLDVFGADTAFLGRYITFANLYWIGLIGLVFAVRPVMSKRTNRGLGVYLGLLVAMKLGTVGNVVSSALPHAQEVRQAAVQLRACYPDTDRATLEAFFGPTQMRRAKRHLEYLEANQVSLFRQAQDKEACVIREE